VARRPGQLTEEDKLKLLNQGVFPESNNELDIVKARYRLARDCSIVEVKSGSSYKEVLGSIEYVLNTTENDGGKFLIMISRGREREYHIASSLGHSHVFNLIHAEKGEGLVRDLT
jgi:hypothetical protein